MIDQQTEIPTRDGHVTTFISHPERCGPHPAIIFIGNDCWRFIAGDCNRRPDIP